MDDTHSSGKLTASSQFFRAHDGRAVFLRGVNLSSSVKQPRGLPSHISFVGRPFPLHEADEHFGRLKSWGFNFLRFNVTWEAIEHKGPGIYDDEYIAYVIQVLLKAKEFGFRVFIDPHQDVWSRFTGGSGAPGWTLDLVGFEMKNFAAGNAAIVHNVYTDKKNFPKMIWATNYFKLAAATMFTLFFAGATFAPNLKVDGVSIQKYLQSHFFNAISRLAQAVVDTDGLADAVVMGYDTLNEPSGGWIECYDISKVMHQQELKVGLTATPLQALMLGNGVAVTEIELWDIGSLGPQRVDMVGLDPKGIRAWKKDVECLWAKHGVWDPKTNTALRPEYFNSHPITGEPISFLVNYWKPFVNQFTLRLREVHNNCIIFVEPPVGALPCMFYESDAQGPLAFAPHWYDGLTLLNKSFNSWFTVDYIGYIRGKYSSIAFALKFGILGIKSCFASQLNMLKLEGQINVGNYPCVFGEIGIPFDMDLKQAYSTGNYSSQIKAMDANMSALESTLVNFTLWTYCSDNSNEWGDNWNGEDLSLWSPPLFKSDDFDVGARALHAFVRPCPIYIPGIPRSVNFDLKTLTFEVKFSIESYYLGNNMLELFVPSIHFQIETTEVTTSGGTYRWDETIQRLYYTPPKLSPLTQLECSSIMHYVKLVSKMALPIRRENNQRPPTCPACTLM